MIEKILEQIIHEIGAAGILIIGLYFILMRVTDKICMYLMNNISYLEKIEANVKKCVDQLCVKTNVKN